MPSLYCIVFFICSVIFGAFIPIASSYYPNTHILRKTLVAMIPEAPLLSSMEYVVATKNSYSDVNELKVNRRLLINSAFYLSGGNFYLFTRYACTYVLCSH